jgi:hypothetical protein
MIPVIRDDLQRVCYRVLEDSRALVFLVLQRPLALTGAAEILAAVCRPDHREEMAVLGELFSKALVKSYRLPSSSVTIDYNAIEISSMRSTDAYAVALYEGRQHRSLNEVASYRAVVSLVTDMLKDRLRPNVPWFQEDGGGGAGSTGGAPAEARISFPPSSRG